MSQLLSRISRFFKTAQWVILQTMQRNILSLKRSYLFSPTTQPSAFKIISHRTDLYRSRVFRPQLSDPNSNSTPLPLIILAHGGGFLMNNPALDDPLARYLSNACNALAVNIDYRKAPRHPFPAAYEDVVTTTLELLGDEGNDLPIDPRKVVLLGSSAGGNLVLGAAQDPRLRGRVLGIVSLYPLVSLVPSAAEMMATRPDPSVPDFLDDAVDNVRELYVQGADVGDVRVSPTYFRDREDLPRKVFMLGCEHDMLCAEARGMAERLGGLAEGSKREGRKGDDWEVGGVRWKLVKGQTHGFDGFAKRNACEEEQRVKVKEGVYADVAGWVRGVFDGV